MNPDDFVNVSIELLANLYEPRVLILYLQASTHKEIEAFYFVK